MPKVTHHIHAEIDLSKPVPEICGVIAHVLQAWQGKEKEVLENLRSEIDSHLKQLEKGDDQSGKSIPALKRRI